MLELSFDVDSTFKNIWLHKFKINFNQSKIIVITIKSINKSILNIYINKAKRDIECSIK